MRASLLGVLSLSAQVNRYLRHSLRSSLSWNDFTDRLQRAADTQYEKGWDEERYVARAAELLSNLGRIQDSAKVRADAQRALRASIGPEFESLWTRRTLAIVFVAFQPGDEIRPHNHPGMRFRSER